MKKIIVVLLLVHSLFDCGAKAVPYFVVVDESGCPVPGAKVRMKWIANMHEPNERHERREFVSDQDGFFCPDSLFVPSAKIEEVTCKGYLFENYLNVGLADICFSASEYPKTNPCKLVMRKLLPEKDIVLDTRGRGKGDFKIVRRGESVKPLPLWVVHKPGGKEPQDADCFALPEYDELSKEWKCIFWTTNSNGGVLATTNRVFIAPQTGYVNRVEVPLAMCFDPAFTLYVKTWNPQLYAMFRIHGFATVNKEKFCHNLRIPGNEYYMKEFPDSGKLYGGVQVDMCTVNPFGGRNVDVNYDTRQVIDFDYYLEVLLELAQHRYPPRPDMPARVGNMRRRKVIREEILGLVDESCDLRNRLEKLKDGGNGGVPINGAEHEEVKKQKAENERKMVELRKELRRLESEAPTLNLPSGMTEKDKYSDKK